MPFSAFNHLYGLFATISSALVGFKVAQEYLADRFEGKMEKFRARIDIVGSRIINIKKDAEAIIKDIARLYDGKVPKAVNELAEEAKRILNDFENTQHPQSNSKTRKGAGVLKTAADTFKDNLSNGFWLRKTENEQRLVTTICSNLGVFAFLFCVMMLILAGFQDMGFNRSSVANNDFYFKMVADFELILFTVTATVVLLYSFNARGRNFVHESSYGRVLVLFLSISIASFILASLSIHLPTWLSWFGVVRPVWIFAFSFVFGFFPFIGLICRYFIYLEILYARISGKFFRLERRVDGLEKKLSREILPD